MRIGILKKITLLSFLFLIFSLAYNQIIRGPYYFQLSQNNRIKLIKLAAARGDIYDRKGRILAGTRLMFNAAILSQEVRDIQQTLKGISPILGIGEKELMRQYRKNFSAPFTPVVVAYDISKEDAITLECREADFPGLIIQTEPIRDYPDGPAFCHVLGYLGSLREEELERLKIYGLRVKDLIGRSGVEKNLDPYLRGQLGGMQVEVNNRGHKVRVLGLRQPQKGQGVRLTIDAELQELINGLWGEEKGACIVLNPQNGEVLALVSKSDFDPNLFIAAFNGRPGASGKLQEILTSPDAVLVNRAISGTYPPGSVFKIVTGSAGLESGEITTETRFDCPGSLKVGRRRFFCWKRDGHGSQNLVEAIAHSCNVFFYNLGLILGPDRLAQFAGKFGLGRLTGIDLPFEAKGFVPSRDWKLKRRREQWWQGETANFAIGQGYLLATPLQVAQLISATANDGYLVRPHVVAGIGERSYPVYRKKIGIKKENIGIIKQGMYQVIYGDKGTAAAAKVHGVKWGAKTGTAQASRGKSHAWFGGFYPLEDPRIALVVFLEHGGSGGGMPAVIARNIIKHIIENEMD